MTERIVSRHVRRSAADDRLRREVEKLRLPGKRSSGWQRRKFGSMVRRTGRPGRAATRWWSCRGDRRYVLIDPVTRARGSTRASTPWPRSRSWRSSSRPATGTRSAR